MITKYIKGDITKTELNYIVHGVNCQNVMGSGVAKALFDEWFQVKAEYHIFVTDMMQFANLKPEDLLGGYHYVFTEDIESFKETPVVINAFTQLNYGYDKTRHVNYEAVSKVFSRLNEELSGKTIAIPKIGCGLAGGDWEIVRRIIDEVTPDIEIWVYEL